MKKNISSLGKPRNWEGGVVPDVRAMAKAPIPTVGTLIRFLDPEGNDVGAMHYEQTPHT